MAYAQCLQDPSYDPLLYKAHLEEVTGGLLIHLDDPVEEMRNSILAILKQIAHVAKDIVLDKTRAVRHKHRSQAPCDALIAFTEAL